MSLLLRKLEAAVSYAERKEENGNFIMMKPNPDAGDILFELATNFLLYTALVLITYLVVKLYIESSPDNPLFDEEVSFHRVPHPAKVQEDRSKMFNEIELKNMKGNRGSISVPSRWGSKIFFDVDGFEELPTKNEVIKNLLFMGIGLNITYVLWGVLQERILKMSYGEGDFFTFSYGLVLTNRALGLLFSGILLYCNRPKWSKALAYEYSLPSVTNMLSSWCQYEALKFVTFPTQVLSKAFKIAPIMIMGMLLGNKKYPLYDFVVAGVIGLGVALFVVSSEGLKLGADSFDEHGGSIGCGLLLLLLYLVFDSFTSQWQSRMFTKHRDLSPIQMMFVMNAFSTVFSLVTLVHEGDLTQFFKFVQQNPEIHLHFIAFSFLATAGQLLIFHTIKSFGAVVFAIIMTIRIALSILVSCLIYDHDVPEMGIIGMILVFCAVAYRIQRRMEDGPLFRWRQTENLKAPEIIHEWHEHLDF